MKRLLAFSACAALACLAVLGGPVFIAPAFALAAAIGALFVPQSFLILDGTPRSIFETRRAGQA